MLNGYADNGELSFKEWKHIIITNNTTELEGVCSFCNINTCT